MADIPWPPSNDLATALGLDDRYFSSGERRKAYRVASKRWHPDRFRLNFGADLVESERDEILSRVLQVSQAINDVFHKSRL